MEKKWTRRSALGLLAGGAGLLAYDSAGFTQIDAVRDAEVEVTDDESAVLGLSLSSVEVAEGTEFVLFSVTNNFDDDGLTVTEVSVENDDDLPFAVDIVELPENLDANETGDIVAVVRSSTGALEADEADIELKITGETDDGDTVVLDRTVKLTVRNGINFEPGTVRSADGTPAGFFSDIGQAFTDEADEDNGIDPRLEDDHESTAYGWFRGGGKIDQKDAARNRGDDDSDARANETLIHLLRNNRIPTRYNFQNDGVWQFALEPGEYDVTLHAGDPDFRNSEHSFNIFGLDGEEGVDDPPPDDVDVLEFRDPENIGGRSRQTNFEVYNGRIEIPDEIDGDTVSDPRLTLQARTEDAPNAWNPKVNWIRIQSVEASPDFTVAITDVSVDSGGSNPAIEGEVFEVTADVTNNGGIEIPARVQLRADRTDDGEAESVVFDDDGELSATDLEFDSNEKKEVTLRWQTVVGDAGEDITIEVSVVGAEDNGDPAVDTEEVTIETADTDSNALFLNQSNNPGSARVGSGLWASDIWSVQDGDEVDDEEDEFVEDDDHALTWAGWVRFEDDERENQVLWHGYDDLDLDIEDDPENGLPDEALPDRDARWQLAYNVEGEGRVWLLNGGDASDGSDDIRLRSETQLDDVGDDGEWRFIAFVSPDADAVDNGSEGEIWVGAPGDDDLVEEGDLDDSPVDDWEHRPLSGVGEVMTLGNLPANAEDTDDFEGEAFEGTFKHVALWDRALSDSEIEELFPDFESDDFPEDPVDDDGLVLWWKFEDGEVDETGVAGFRSINDVALDSSIDPEEEDEGRVAGVVGDVQGGKWLEVTGSALANLEVADESVEAGDEVTIVNPQPPFESGDDNDVRVDVENLGVLTETFEVTLEITPDGEDEPEVDETVDVEVVGRDTETVTFEGVIEDLDLGEYDVSVSTDDDEIEGELQVVDRCPHWPLDESEYNDSTVDDPDDSDADEDVFEVSGRDINGTSVRGVSPADGVEGDTDRAAEFDRSEQQFVKITDGSLTANDDNPDEGSQQITISAWLNPATVDGNEPLEAVSIGNRIALRGVEFDEAVGGFYYEGESEDTDGFSYTPEFEGDFEPRDDATALEEDTWTHVAYVVDNEGDDNEQRLYINGTLEATTTHEFNVNYEDDIGDTELTTIGKHGGTDEDRHWDGKIQSVRICSKALDNDEIETLAEEFEQPAFFEVTIDDTNDPITAGETLEVEVTVENTGDFSGTQDITLSVDTTGDEETDTEVDVEEVSLDSGEATELTLEWGTEDGDVDEDILVEVASDDDSDDTTVTVEQLMADQFDAEGAEDEVFRAATGTGQAGVGFPVKTKDGAVGTVELVEIGVPFADGGGGNQDVEEVFAEPDDDGELVAVEDDSQDPPLQDPPGVLLDLEGDSIDIGEDEDPVELDQPLEITDDEELLLLQRFRDQDGDGVNMNNDDADILLVFDDGSRLTLEFRNI